LVPSTTQVTTQDEFGERTRTVRLITSVAA
jgi:hypothetical protein